MVAKSSTKKRIHNKVLAYVSLVMVFVSSCNITNTKPDPDPEPNPVLTSLSLSVSTNYSVMNSAIPIRFRVSGALSNGRSASVLDYSIIANGNDIGKITFFNPDQPDTYEIYAQVGDIKSDTVQVEIRNRPELEEKEFTVIFHIVHDGELIGEGYNIESDRIDYQMSLLEATFSNPNSALTSNSTYSGMRFKLAASDPQGQALDEPGIHRIQRPDLDHSILFQDWMWDHYWDPDYYINVWVGDTKNGFSWGIFPDVSCDSSLEGLGCTDEPNPVRIHGIALELNNLWEGNWVFPHEMGHYFGLFHVFGPQGCSSDADFSKDTYFYDRNQYESGVTSHERTSCSGITYTSYNVMDYWSQPAGGRDLTYDQVERIRYIIEHGRFRASLDPDTGLPRNMSVYKQTLPYSYKADYDEHRNMH